MFVFAFEDVKSQCKWSLLPEYQQATSSCRLHLAVARLLSLSLSLFSRALNLVARTLWKFLWFCISRRRDRYPHSTTYDFRFRSLVQAWAKSFELSGSCSIYNKPPKPTHDNNFKKVLFNYILIHVRICIKYLIPVLTIWNYLFKCIFSIPKVMFVQQSMYTSTDIEVEIYTIILPNCIPKNVYSIIHS